MLELYMSAEETATALGINVATIYAYVSRGMIRSQRVSGSKRRLYWRADVERLRRADAMPVAAAVLPERLVESTKITLLTPHGHFYRGIPARYLARTASLEEAAALLWQADPTSLFRGAVPTVPKAAMRRRGRNESVWQRTIKMLFAVEQADARAYDLTREGYCRSGADTLRCVAAACLDLTTLSTRPIHLLIGETLGVDAAVTDILRQYLVLAADHELDPTTYCVRAAANTGVTPYAAIAAGLVSAAGRRLVFGQFGTMARMLAEIDQAADPRQPISNRIREGQPLPGFGSSSYPDGDPRAAHLLDLLTQVYGDDPSFQRLKLAIATVREATGTEPSFVIPGLFLERRIGIGPEQAIILRLARVVGWLAHAMEQYYDSGLVRPHAHYDGVLPVVEPVRNR